MSIVFLASTDLPTDAGVFTFQVFQDTETNKEHILLSCGELDDEGNKKNILLRIHSSCLTGECFLSKKCDCGPQLHTAMQMIQEEGSGMIIYLFQEGRGIGLVNKIKAYALQAQGLDTVEANEQLGFAPDERTYEMVGEVCKTHGISSCRLITNNPAKIAALTSMGISVTERIALEIPTNEVNQSYYRTKKNKMGHLFSQQSGVAGTDSYFMHQALLEAKICKNTLPNPRVGAVIVNNGKIAGRGHTQTYGGNHAEVEALRDAGEQAQGATLYVTLEPCCHQEKPHRVLMLLSLLKFLG